MSLYALLKWVHVLSAVAAVGSNLTYGIWLARAARTPEVLPFTLKTIKTLDDRLANPAYGLLLVTGLAMVFVLPYPIATPWILTSLILYAALFLLGILAYSPTLRSQIELAESEGPASEAYQAATQRGATLGIVIGVITVVIIFLMVTKPPLWG
jgi:uncharacterized membrane protein